MSYAFFVYCVFDHQLTVFHVRPSQLKFQTKPVEGKTWLDQPLRMFYNVHLLVIIVCCIPANLSASISETYDILSESLKFSHFDWTSKEGYCYCDRESGRSNHRGGGSRVGRYISLQQQLYRAHNIINNYAIK